MTDDDDDDIHVQLHLMNHHRSLPPAAATALC
jgi:hypothetical protein